ncbi:KxYKxGKxW signal peptide domain-containing protein [Fructilactobacillus sp. Tb1]|uniref:KxYKxGKxW signal peptide domain-containing protein n=1 Tax=Fructilactobacillus sp. Tb1 TaxID=3422304 RepID=UPI003D27AB7B
MFIKDEKKHFKMYKAGKKWLVSAIATAVVTVGGFIGVDINSNANADTVEGNEPTEKEAISTTNDPTSSTATTNTNANEQQTQTQASQDNNSSAIKDDNIVNLDTKQPAVVQNQPAQTQSTSVTNPTPVTADNTQAASTITANNQQTIQPSMRQAMMQLNTTNTGENIEGVTVSVTDANPNADGSSNYWQDPNAQGDNATEFIIGYSGVANNKSTTKVTEVAFATDRSGNGNLFIYELDANNNVVNHYEIDRPTTPTDPSNPDNTYNSVKSVTPGMEDVVYKDFIGYNANSETAGDVSFSYDWFNNDRIAKKKYSNFRNGPFYGS